MSEWLVPFKGRNRSLSFDQNFLWRKDNIFIMDNHRAALWCWLQHMSPEGENKGLNLRSLLRTQVEIPIKKPAPKSWLKILFTHPKLGAFFQK